MKANGHISEPPPSLAQHFDAPEDYIGHFGWLCGYSADAAFLNDAAERFTRFTISQRAQQGRFALAVLLDPGSPRVSLLAAPGVAHLPIRGHASKPFRLLHAKVALLGFRHQEDRNQWQLRLLVSTGNWTRQTLEASLDLVWRIDVGSASLSHPDVDTRQDCMDIKTVWNLFDWLRSLFDTRLLNASVNDLPSETTLAMQQVSLWISACSKKAKGAARVFDSRSKSLLSQLPEMVKGVGEVRRNYLAMGSGFYETSSDQKKPPEVPVAIVDSLRKAGLLTNNASVDLYVNPMACQSIATAVKPLQKFGIAIRTAIAQPSVFGENAQRSLHAKFLFSANSRDGSNACTSPWVYLGSGNLTHPGFAYKMGAHEGNLEVGVVFALNTLCWEEEASTEGHLLVTNLLPIQWDDAIDDATALSAGAGMEQRDDIYVEPPVAWLAWHEAEGNCELRTKESMSDHVRVLDSTGIACPRTKYGFQWREAQPRQVCISWQANGATLESQIPVIDQYGRIAATELAAIDIDEALWNLADFPMPPDDDDDGDDGDDGNRGNEKKKSRNKAKGRAAQTITYPIRQMMELIESIAAKQTAIDEMDWVLWCNRLEQTLGQAGSCAPVRYFNEELKLNPLSPLRHESFRPAFAENCGSEPGKLYDDTLDRIEIGWKVNDLIPIGGAK
jgi:hypothetical protein